ncbi:MAG: hypothetical protein AAGF46_04235 [Pseudomonadota bacterium]
MNERYSRERSQTDLALRMIAYEARTNTIRSCTGLSDDRIRKLCSQYFTNRDGQTVRRRRGKSPKQVARYVKNAEHQLQATTLMHMFLVYGLLAREHRRQLSCPWPDVDVAFGLRVCDAYATYGLIHTDALFTFEWAWNLLQALSRDEELAIASCSRCGADYLHDRYALNFHVCPACEIRTERRRRPGARQFADS